VHHDGAGNEIDSYYRQSFRWQASRRRLCYRHRIRRIRDIRQRSRNSSRPREKYVVEMALETVQESALETGQ